MKKIIIFFLVFGMFSYVDLFSAAGGGGAESSSPSASRSIDPRVGIPYLPSMSQASENKVLRLIAVQYERRGLIGDAAYMYKAAGDEVNAERSYRAEAEWRESDRYFKNAADCYQKLGDEVNAQRLYRAAAENYEADGRFRAAAGCYQQLGDEVNAQRLYRVAAEFYERRGIFHDAADCCEKLGDAEQAQRLYRVAAEEYERRGNSRFAGYMYKKAGDAEQAQRSLRVVAEKGEKGNDFQYAADVYKELGDEVNAQRLYRAEAKQCEKMGINFQYTAEMYKAAGDKKMSLFMRYISLLKIDSESRTLLQQHKYIEALQSLFEKKVISEEVFNVFMFDGKSPISFVLDSRHFEIHQGAPRIRNVVLFPLEGLKSATHLLQGNAPIFARAIHTANQADTYKRREADQGSSKEAEDKE